jgi:hypothetical protein
MRQRFFRQSAAPEVTTKRANDLLSGDFKSVTFHWRGLVEGYLERLCTRGLLMASFSSRFVTNKVLSSHVLKVGKRCCRGGFERASSGWIKGVLVLYGIFNRYRDERSSRMSYFADLLDWLGGYPFEEAKPEAVFDFFRARGFELVRLRTVGGRLGNDEYVSICI